MNSIFKQMGSVIKNYIDTKLSYDLATYIVGKPSSNEALLRFRSARTFNIVADQTSGQFKSGTAATSITTFTIKKNSVVIGNAVFPAGGTSATITLSASVVVNVGDMITITAPATVDATLADIDVTLIGYLV